MLFTRLSLTLLCLCVALLLPVAGTASGVNPPQAAFSVFPAQPTTNDAVLLDAGPSMPGDIRIARYEWDFDGDGAADATSEQAQVRHFFEESGTFQVTLRVSDNAGGSGVMTQQVQVLQAPVSARRSLEMTLEPNRVLAGGSFFVTVTIQVNEAASGLGLSEVVPAGWRTRPVDDGGGLFKRAQGELQWLWAQSLDPGQSVSVRYAVDVPETVLRGSYALNGTVSSFLPNRFRLPVYGLFDVEVL